MTIIDHPTVLGIIGYPLSHTLSPVMHTKAIESHSINYTYLPFEVHPDHLKNAVIGIKGLNIRGVNVTVPHKENVIPLLDEISKEAALIGAVNTISLEGGRLIGYNTDGVGFVTSLQEDAGVSPEGKTVLILGAGGAARAVATQLALCGVTQIIIANRTFDRASVLGEHILARGGTSTKVQAIPYETDAVRKELARTDIIVNTTSLGMLGKNEIKDFPYDALRESHLVSDLVYNPLETFFLKESRKRGTKILNGLGMLLYQGSRSFELWTGKKFPVEIIRPILEKKFLP